MMNTITFDAHVRDGNIKIPEKYHNLETENIEVILIVKDRQIDSGIKMKSDEEQKKIVSEDLRASAEKIGGHVRYIGFGIIGLCFAIISAYYNSANKLHLIPVKIVLIAALCGLMTILFDYLQCLAGYISSFNALKNENYKFNKSWYSHRLRKVFFFLKQIFAIIGSFILIIGISTIL